MATLGQLIRGDVVLPASPPHSETIVGIVIGDRYDDMVPVAWLSDQRGAFTCHEWVSDLAVAQLRDRDEITDPRIAHRALADAIAATPTVEVRP